MCEHVDVIRSVNVEANIRKNYLRTTVQFLADNITMVPVKDVPTSKYKEILWCRRCNYVLRALAK